MVNAKSGLAVLLACGCAFVGAAGTAAPQKRSQSTLPPGVYKYLGTSPGLNPPRQFTVDFHGEITWDDTAVGDKVDETSPPPEGGPDDAYVTYKYPVIKWKITDVKGTLKAVARLTTTFESGLLKYQILVQAQKGAFFGKGDSLYEAVRTNGLSVEMLDQERFRVGEFHIAGNLFHRVNENQLEARGDIPVPEHDYKKTRAVNLR